MLDLQVKNVITDAWRHTTQNKTPLSNVPNCALISKCTVDCPHCPLAGNQPATFYEYSWTSTLSAKLIVQNSTRAVNIVSLDPFLHTHTWLMNIRDPGFGHEWDPKQWLNFLTCNAAEWPIHPRTAAQISTVYLLCAIVSAPLLSRYGKMRVVVMRMHKQSFPHHPHTPCKTTPCWSRDHRWWLIWRQWKMLNVSAI